jgi:hypothetical protein
VQSPSPAALNTLLATLVGVASASMNDVIKDKLERRLGPLVAQQRKVPRAY